MLINELCQPLWGSGREFLVCGFQGNVVSILLEEVPQDNTAARFGGGSASG